MYLASTDAGNELLERDPAALLIGTLLGRQIRARTPGLFAPEGS
jgi:hypothetical protein